MTFVIVIGIAHCQETGNLAETCYIQGKNSCQVYDVQKHIANEKYIGLWL